MKSSKVFNTWNKPRKMSFVGKPMEIVDLLTYCGWILNYEPLSDKHKQKLTSLIKRIVRGSLVKGERVAIAAKENMEHPIHTLNILNREEIKSLQNLIQKYKDLENAKTIYNNDIR